MILSGHKGAKMQRIYSLCLLVFSVSLTSAQTQNPIEYQGLDRLLALAQRVPHLLEPRDLAVGDWKVMKTESAYATEFDRNTQTRSEIVDFTDTQITLKTQSRTRRRNSVSDQILPRLPEFAEEYLLRRFARMRKDRNILRIRITKAEYQGRQERKVAGKKLMCDKVFLAYEFDYLSSRAPTAHLGTGGHRITIWYHESVPIDGVVRRESAGYTSVLEDYGRVKDGP